MDKVFNIPRRITDDRRSKNGKIALASWLSIKFAYGNSTKYDISKDAIKEFYHCGEKYAKDIIKAMWDNDDLFFVNKKKNCVFAKSCKNRKEIKHRTIKNKEYEYKSDDVITVKIPESYLKSKDEKETMSLKELLTLVDYILICKEYDNQSKYKLSKGDPRGCEGICETNERKSMSYVAKKVGLKRGTLINRIKSLIRSGYSVKKGGDIERCSPKEKNAVRGLNKLTRLPYWFVCVPAYLELTEKCPFVFRHIIWDCEKRLKAKMPKQKFLGSFTFDANDKEHVDYYFDFLHD